MANLSEIVFVLVILIRTSMEIVESNIIQVWSAPGGETRMPCDLAASARDVAMMMWFKDGDRMPIYTVDFRNGPPIHWAVAGEFGTRSHFVLNESDPSSAHLVVEKVTQLDEGVYRCRIDYIDAPTRNYRVNLTVIVPPESPRVLDSEGREVEGSLAGPYREGQELKLTCQADGGKPPPDITWYHGDDRLAIARDASSCLVRVTLSREMSGAKLRCRVDPPLLKTIVRDVTLKLYLKPQYVRVTGGGPTRASHERSFVCTTRGSKPAPNVDWFINAQRIDSSLTQVEVDGEVTKSILTWRVRREDSGRELACRVSNPWFPAHTLEDSIVLEVLYPPIPQISLIEPRDSRQLREDQDAVLLCSADASPPAYNFSFYKGFEDHLVRDDPIGGISIEGQKLFLHNLRRHHSARYRCRAWNSEGSGLSEPMNLNVLSRPECSAGSVVQHIAGAPGGEVRARCSVSAPSARDAGPLKFYWTYNGTKDVLPIPVSNVTTMGSSSTVIHGLPSIDDEEDLGWLACWARNDIGNQREPCLFRIMPAGYPEPPSKCEVDGSYIRCEAGHDGGLPQWFVMEALGVKPYEHVRNEIDSTMNDQGISGRGLTETVYKTSNDASPQFALDALSPGRYTFLIYAENPRGRSLRPAALHGVPVRTVDDLDRPDSLQTMTPAPPQVPIAPQDNGVALLVGAALSLVLLTILTTICVTMVVMCKKETRPRRDTETNATTRNVGVSMYSGVSGSRAPTVLVRGRGSRVLAARWSAVLDDTPLAMLALDSRSHANTDSHSDGDIHETAFIRHGNMETQTDS
ncbi:carcinoembryonic antigen-related cell adhesion molecule 5-like [Colias croceus]|uniref:carcinoembryonic antigen-related cell adhesion molecule 5-like n=1 Tax=Colias crocea TaxID=72248 RepID=UPI001E27DF45|nr:carcinoembryonic antigen-related cell adhesion molecule 5-like [Colias croceus]